MKRRKHMALLMGSVGAATLMVMMTACSGGDAGGSTTIAPTATAISSAPGFPDIDVEIDEELWALMKEAIAELPEPEGDNDRDQIRSMIGLPDAFTISFERSGEEGDGPIIRYETWYYYELFTAYEFADGDLISNLPMEPVEGIILLPKKYDPASFERATTWDEIKPMLVDPDSFEPIELEPEYEVPLVFYAGEQLLVAFDDEGLFYVESVPLGQDE